MGERDGLNLPEPGENCAVRGCCRSVRGDGEVEALSICERTAALVGMNDLPGDALVV